MWKLYCLLLILVNKSIQEKSFAPYSVPKSGATPAINKLPDLTEASTYYACKSIKGTKACPGYDYYIPTTGYYIYSDVSEFDSYVNKEVNNDSGLVIALCPDANIQHDLAKLPYRYSLYCGRYMYAQARWCKENPQEMRANPQLSLCKSSCIEYAKSIVDYGVTVCKNTDNSVAEKARDNIIKNWCNLFTDDSGCIKGTTKESEQCGFNSASLAFNEAPSFNPHNSCWFTEDPNANNSNLDALKKKASEEENQQNKMGGIKWKISYPVVVMVIVGGVTYFFWRKQNEVYKLGYIPASNSQDDYEIIPSSAEPSREYLDADFIKNELEIPQNTLQRNSSFAVRTLSRKEAPKVNTNNSIKYMIAIYNYHAKLDDELELKAGDRIRVEHQYDDGWAAGINETTNKFGAFPLICCSDNISSNQGALPKRNKSSRVNSRKNSTKMKESSPLATKENNIDGSSSSETKENKIKESSPLTTKEDKIQ